MPTIFDYALMAGASYISTRAEINQFPVPTDWTEDPGNQRVNKSSGFEATYFTKGSEIVISYAGTDPSDFLGDLAADLALAAGVLSDQLRQAADYYLAVKASVPEGTKITFTGHSLGGGIASLMAVFFGESAYTFDQAPFLNSARTVITNTPDQLGVPSSVAIDLRSYLTSKEYGRSDLSKLDAFISASDPRNPNPITTDTLTTRGQGVTNINTDGEFLTSWFLVPTSNRIGSQADIANSHEGLGLLGGIDLHAIELLTAFLQSDPNAATNTDPQTKSLNRVTYKLPDLLKMIFDEKLFAYDRGTGNKGNEDFLTRIVKHQAGTSSSSPSDDMVKRFTSDLWKLAQEGGLTISDGTDPDLRWVSDTLIAFAMQMYYENTANASNKDKQLFSTDSIGGGVQFDIFDVSKTFQAQFDADGKINLNDAKGYKEYFTQYLNDPLHAFFTPEERGLINGLLPYLRDWYVQAGATGMTATDSLNRGAFMLGGNGSDTLTGGTRADLLVGNAGADTLRGGQGNDMLLGGAGNDTYEYTEGDGLDTVLDRDGAGSIVIDGATRAGGKEYGDKRVHRDADKHLYVQVDDSTLIVDGKIIVKNYDFTSTGGSLGIALGGADALPNPVISKVINGDIKPTDNNLGVSGIQALDNNDNNPIGTSEDYEDILFGSLNNDHMQGGELNDDLTGDAGDDWLEGGNGNDWLRGASNDSPDDEGKDLLEGGAGKDILIGGKGDDQLFGNTKIDTATAIANGNSAEGTGQKGDWLSGNAGDDVLVGGADNDVLCGGAGDDLLIGGAGDDNLIGDSDWTPKYEPATTASYSIGNKKVYHSSPDIFNWGWTDTATLRTFAPVTGERDPQDSGADVIYAGQGNDYVWAGFGNDVVFGESGNDVLQGEQGNDILLGGSGNDTVVGQDGDDYLDGGDDNDTMLGGDGNDILIAGKGNDELFGEGGQDVYIYNQGDGEDYIEDTLTDNNIIRFGAGVNKDSIKLRLGSLMLDLGNGDAVHIGNFDQSDVFNSASIKSFEFADGSTLTTTELLVRGFDLDGTVADDIIVGTNTTDRINGMAGADELGGGAGNDALWGEAGDDALWGEAGNDTLDGGSGTDYLNGGAGNDTYSIGLGDSLLDGQGRAETIDDTEGANTLVFGAGINIDDLSVGLDDSKACLVIRNKTSGDQVAILGGQNGVIQSYRFASGETLTTAELINRCADVAITGSKPGGGLMVAGGKGGDNLMGDVDNDALFGGGGADVLFGDGGNDTLLGGRGDDALFGGDGADTYHFEFGDGQDLITSWDSIHANDSIEFGSGISLADIKVTNIGTEASPRYAIDYGDGDRIVIESGSESAIGDLKFADGTKVAFSGLWNATAIQGSNDDDTLLGTDDNEYLLGQAGNDLLDGGAGKDILAGGSGSNVYRFALGSGMDRILATTDEQGVLLFDGQAADDLSAWIDGDDLMIANAAGDSVRLVGYGSNPGYFDASWSVQTSDGVVLLLADFIAERSAQANSDLAARKAGFLAEQWSDLTNKPLGAPWNEVTQGVRSRIVVENDVQMLAGQLLEVPGYIASEESSSRQIVHHNDPIYSSIQSPAVYRYYSRLDVASMPGATLNADGSVTLPSGAIPVYSHYSGGEGHQYDGLVGYSVVISGGTWSTVLSGWRSWDEAVTEVKYTDTVTQTRITGTSGDDTVTADASSENSVSALFRGSVETGAGNDTIKFVSGSMGSMFGRWFGSGYINPDSSENRYRDWLNSAGGSADSFSGGDWKFDRGYGAWIDAGSGNDTVAGTDGNDVLIGGEGSDYLDGQAGADTYLISARNGEVDHIADLAEFDWVKMQAYDRLSLVYGGNLGGANSDTVEFDDSIQLSSLSYRWTQSSEGDAYRTLELIRDGEAFLQIDYAFEAMSGDNHYQMSFENWAAMNPNRWGSYDFWSDSVVNREVSMPGVEKFILADGTSLSVEELLATIPRLPDADPLVGDRAPVGYINLGYQYAELGRPFDCAISSDDFVDPDPGDTLTFSASLANGDPLPEWLHFDSSALTFNGVPNVSDVSELDILVTASDNAGRSASSNLTILIDTSTGNTGVQVGDPVADQAATEEAPFVLTIPTTAFDGADLNYGATLADGTPLPVWLTFDATTRTFSGTPTNGDVGNLDLVVTAADASGAMVSQTFALSVANVNDAPTVVEFVTGQETTEGMTFSFTVPANAFADVDVGDSLTYSATLANGDPLPAWLAFDAAHQTFSGTPDQGDVGNVDLLLIATDSTGTSAIQSFAMTVYAAPVAVLNSTQGDDLLIGTGGNDTISGGDGNDTLKGGTGNDTLYGDGGDDVIKGGDGNDQLHGGNGDDVMVGGVGNDSYAGGSGHDTVIFNIGDGADVISEFGQDNDSDQITFGIGIQQNSLGFENIDGNLVVRILNSSDSLTISNWFDGSIKTGQLVFADGSRIDAEEMSRRALGNTPPEMVFPLTEVIASTDIEFNFVLPVGTFIDHDAGDVLTYSAALADGSPLPDWLTFTEATQTFSGIAKFYDEGDLQIVVTVTDTKGLAASGGFQLSVVVHDPVILNGAEGNDVLNGYSGADILNGGAGADTLAGGGGDDTYDVDDPGDSVIELEDDGIDTVNSSISWTLGDNVENLVLTGTGDISATGNDLSNRLVGNSGNNVLVGGGGNDTFIIDNDGDVVVELANDDSYYGGWDTVESAVTYVLGTNVESLILKGNLAIDGTGNELNNRLVGNDADNVLTGGAGEDYLDGGAGADILIGGSESDDYYIDNINDLIIESTDEGRDAVFSSISYTLGANLEWLYLLDGAISGTGNELNNTLEGNDRANILNGQAGNDYILGWNGLDTLIGGAGDDTYELISTDGIIDEVIENFDEGYDTVYLTSPVDGVVYTMTANVEALACFGYDHLNGNPYSFKLIGNSLNNTIAGRDGDDELDGGEGADYLYGGEGNDTYVIDNADDSAHEGDGQGSGWDTVKSSVSRILEVNVEGLILTGTAAINGSGNTLDNLIRGNVNVNTLDGGTGNDILEGGGGNDIFVDGSGSTLFNGGAGDDLMTGGAGAQIYMGGFGNDTYFTGQGNDILLFNKGDGADIFAAGGSGSDIVSLGGDIDYNDLFFSKASDDLVLKVGATDQITFKNWYATTPSKPVANLQVIADAMAGFVAGGSDPLKDQKVETFNFAGLVGAFDTALAANTSLTSWALTNALANFQLAGSDTAAYGGDIAYQYGKSGNLAGIGLNAAQSILGNANLGSSPQVLQPTSILQADSIRLS